MAFRSAEFRSHNLFFFSTIKNNDFVKSQKNGAIRSNIR
ncbi:Uncharacterized protein dnm_056900 [Desulfonema magnum]|uniref:Uncharacterized protein n=1 Tax=Desulfonema magnum TaxID=45655 RepID=A0A975BR17_9BACT|nr:Uncharacterized protein dnm_056900 [Desulfonema magnum]